MRFLILFVILLFMVTSFYSISCSSSGTKEARNCEAEKANIINRLEKCGINETNQSLYSDYLKSPFCETYKDIPSDTYGLCNEIMDKLSCEELGKLDTIDKLNSIPHCFDFPKYTKKDVCESNVKKYCSAFIFEKCGYDKVPEYCHKTGTHKNDEGNGVDVLDLDGNKIDEYCLTTVNADDNISSVEDFFYRTCFNYSIDCNNIQEIDFRNDDWKTMCGE